MKCLSLKCMTCWKPLLNCIDTIDMSLEDAEEDYVLVFLHLLYNLKNYTYSIVTFTCLCCMFGMLGVEETRDWMWDEKQNCGLLISGYI